MDKTTLIVIVILILALFFLGITIISSNSGSTGQIAGSYASQAYSGGGCGR